MSFRQKRFRAGNLLTLRAVAILIVIVACCRANGQNNANLLYREGKSLIERNCTECRGASKQGLEEGIQKVNQAVDGGFADKKEALKLIAEAYNNLAVYAKPGSDERKSLLEKKRQTYQSLTNLFPSDPNILYLYAQSTVDAGLSSSEQLSAYRRVLQADPKYSAARYAVAALLLDSGDRGQGLIELRKAFEDADLENVEPYGNRLIEVLNESGRKEEAPAVSRQIAERLAKYPVPGKR